MADFSRDDLLYGFERSAVALPGAAKAQIRRKLGDEYEGTPIEQMLQGSQLLNYARQRLPENVGTTQGGQKLLGMLPEGAKKARDVLGSLPLGGYSEKEIRELDAYRDGDPSLEMDGDPEVQRNTVRVGKFPVPGGEVPTGDSFRAAATQAAGVGLADLASDGLRNIWWFLNAPQALTQLAMLQGTQNVAQDFQAPGRQAPLIKNRTVRMATTLPALIGVSMAVGNAYRQPGYKAAVPSEGDPTQTADPLAELGSRYFLGRTGALLPYDEFVKERPDVSKSEYDAYKTYLFGNAMPLKATAEGIHGPEVTFLGKSIPVATGVLPAVAAVIGGRIGARKAGARLAGEGKLREAADLRDSWVELKKEARDPDSGISSEDIAAAYNEYEDRQMKNEREVALQTILYSSLGMGGTAIAGQTLESIRRALKGKAPIEEPIEEQAALPATE
jgi:hypothetical protein